MNYLFFAIAMAGIFRIVAIMANGKNGLASEWLLQSSAIEKKAIEYKQ